MKTEREIVNKIELLENTIADMKKSGLKTWHWEYYVKALKWVMDMEV